MLSAEERNTLLEIARTAIESALFHQPFQPSSAGLTDSLRQNSGAFVTLESDGQLRGCIGSVQAVEPLYLAVARNAVNAAFKDPRFPALSASEWPAIHLEISVMGPIEPVLDLPAIQVGRDGLIVRKGSRAGLLLPQVAVEWGWDRETFLSQTCIKAGLDPDCWLREGCLIEKFSAEVFSKC